METIISKISSYNLFNYLFTGIVFAIFLYAFLDIKLYIVLRDTSMQMANIFWIYFIGLTISRIGSVILEPFFKVFVKHADYKDYINAEKNDPKVEILSEQNNIYRTLVSVLVVLLAICIIKICDCNICLSIKENHEIVILISLLLLYIFSYVKQTKFVIKRVDKYKESQNV